MSDREGGENERKRERGREIERGREREEGKDGGREEQHYIT